MNNHYVHLRNKAYDDLCCGVQNNDTAKINLSVNKLSVCASRPDQIGFSLADLHGHHNRVSEKLSHLSDLLQYKKKMLQNYYLKVSRDNGAGNTNAALRQSLSSEIQILSKDNSILTQIKTILGNELHRRGEVINMMTEERHSLMPVTTR